MNISNHELEHKDDQEKNESNIQYLWDNIKHANLHRILIQKEDREKEIKNVFEEINERERVPDLAKGRGVCVWVCVLGGGVGVYGG